MYLGDKTTDGKLSGLDIDTLLSNVNLNKQNLTALGSLTQGVDPRDTITETTSPKGFGFSGDDGRDIHIRADVTISNGTSSSVSESVTVKLYDGVDTTGTVILKEGKSVSVAANSSKTVTFIATEHKLDNGDYYIDIATSGTTLAVDQTDEHTKGATITLGQNATGDVHLRDQDGLDKLTVNSVGPIEFDNADLKVNKHLHVEYDIQSSLGDMLLRSTGGGSDAVRVWDEYNSQDLFRANEGGPNQLLTTTTELGDGSGNAGMKLEAGNNTGDAPFIHFNTGGAGQFEIRHFADQNDLELRDRANGTNLMTWDQSGRINALTTFDMNGNDLDNVLRITGDSNGVVSIQPDASGGRAEFYDSVNNNKLLVGNVGGDLATPDANLDIRRNHIRNVGLHGKDPGFRFLGSTHESVSGSYPYVWYKILDLNGDTGNLHAEVEILIYADDNYHNYARYSVTAARHSGTTSGRLDGVTAERIAGKPRMMETKVQDNAVWIRATQKWGGIAWRIITDRGNMSFNTNSTTSGPTALVTTQQNFYYNHDSSTLNKFPTLNQNGDLDFGNNVQLYENGNGELVVSDSGGTTTTLS